MLISKHEMIRSALFLFGLVVLIAISSLLFQPKNNNEAYGMELDHANGILGEQEASLDVLFVGDSVSYCSIIPVQIWRDYGLTSYLCSSTMQHLYVSKEFMEKAFENQSPKLVFLGTATIFNHFTEQEKIWNSLEKNIPVLRYHDRWKTFTSWPEWKTGLKTEYAHLEIQKGYNYNKGVVGADIGDTRKPTDALEWIPPINKKTVEEIAELCNKNGAKLILVSEPNASGSWAPHRHNAIALLAEEMGLDYLDLNYMTDEVPIDWATDTFDGGDHLNYSGAQKVTAYLGKYLWNMGIFEDKRTDKKYESWNEAQKLFYEDIGE